MRSMMSGHYGINIKGGSIVKKLIALLFAIIVVIALIAGCGGMNTEARPSMNTEAKPGMETEPKPEPTITSGERRAG